MRNVLGSKKVQKFSLFVVLCVLAASAFAMHASARRDAAWVNGHVKWVNDTDGSAKPRVVDWENECTDTFNYNKAHMPHSTEGQQREVVNASAYNQSVWLSRRNDPRDVNNTPVVAGQAVNMQINDMVFLCAIITMNASGFGIAGDHKVTNTNYPNDRDPVPDSGAAQYKVNQASRYESNSKIYRVWVSQGPGSISNSPIGDILGYKRDPDSRYWNAPAVPFTYNVPANLAPGTYTVTINFEYATIQTYHAYGEPGTNRCTLASTGDGANVTYNAYNRCERQVQPYRFTFVVRAPGNAVPSSTVDKPAIGYPDTAAFTHYLNASNFSNGGNYAINYSVQRYRNGNPSGAPQTGTYNFTRDGQFTLKANQFNSGAGDAGDRICERLTLSVPPGQLIRVSGNPSEACTVVVTRPYLSVNNNDVWAGSRFDLAHNKCSGIVPRLSSIASWVTSGAGAGGEYGVFALGPVTDFGSGHLPGGNGMTFANSPGLGSLGATTRCVPDYYSEVGTGGATALPNVINLNALSGTGKKKYVVNGDAIILGGTVPKGLQAAILVNGNVRIVGDTSYGGGYNNATDISSLWVIARGNINIQDTVQNLVGMYVTQNTLQTCVVGLTNGPPNPLTTNNCTNQLTIYGAILADRVFWQRTHGTAAPGQPYAESINFDTGLYEQSPVNTTTGTGTPTIQDTKELPPIY